MELVSFTVLRACFMRQRLDSRSTFMPGVTVPRRETKIPEKEVTERVCCNAKHAIRIVRWNEHLDSQSEHGYDNNNGHCTGAAREEATWTMGACRVTQLSPHSWADGDSSYCSYARAIGSSAAGTGISFEPARIRRVIRRFGFHLDERLHFHQTDRFAARSRAVRWNRSTVRAMGDCCHMASHTSPPPPAIFLQGVFECFTRSDTVCVFDSQVDSSIWPRYWTEHLDTN